MYTQSITEDIKTTAISVLTSELEVDYSLFDPQLSRTEVAKDLGICLRTLYEYLTFGAENIPELSKYLSESNGLNRRKIDSVDVVYLQEITDLRKRFTKDRVKAILQRKYQGL